MSAMEALVVAPQWQYPLETLKSNSPSLKDGISFEEELAKQSRGVRFIAEVCEQLHLPPATVYTAITYFHRFYLRHSHKRVHFFEAAGACVFLASKAEETSRRLKEVGIACTRVALKQPKMVVADDSRDLNKWMAVITRDEELLLEAIYFDFDVQNPYVELKLAIDSIQQSDNVQLQQNATQFINDSCKTVIQNVYGALVIAAGAILWASTANNLEIAEVDGQTWFTFLGYSREDLVTVANTMIDMLAKDSIYKPIA